MQLVLMQGLAIVIGQFPSFEYSLSLCEAFSEWTAVVEILVAESLHFFYVNVYGCHVLRDVVRCLVLFKWRVTISHEVTRVATSLVCNVSGYFGSIKPYPSLSAVSQNSRLRLDDQTTTLLCLHYYLCNAHHMFARGRPSPISPLKTWLEARVHVSFKIRVGFCTVPRSFVSFRFILISALSVGWLTLPFSY